MIITRDARVIAASLAITAVSLLFLGLLTCRPDPAPIPSAPLARAIVRHQVQTVVDSAAIARLTAERLAETQRRQRAERAAAAAQRIADSARKAADSLAGMAHDTAAAYVARTLEADSLRGVVGEQRVVINSFRADSVRADSIIQRRTWQAHRADSIAVAAVAELQRPRGRSWRGETVQTLVTIGAWEGAKAIVRVVVGRREDPRPP